MDRRRYVALASLAWMLNATPAASQHNAARIVVPASGLPTDTGPARVYPSTINLTATPEVFSVSVILHNLQHPCPEDLDILLVGPDGTGVTLMSDAGGCSGLLTPLTLTFADSAFPAPATPLSDGATYRPTNLGAWPDYYPSPAPGGTLQSTLSVFRGKSSSGSWRLFVVDDQTGNRGEIQAWTLSLRYRKGFGLGYVQNGIPAGTSGETMGPAFPYPMTVTASGVPGRIENVISTVQLRHQDPDDLDLLLVGPDGRRALFLSDAGGYADVTLPIDLTFDDASFATTIGDNGPLTGGTYRTSSYGTGDTFPAPAPGGPYASSLTTFRFGQANGTWSLYAYDDTQQGTGILSGWLLDLVTTTSLSEPAFSITGPTSFTAKSAIANVDVYVDQPDDALVTWRNAANGLVGIATHTYAGGHTATVPVAPGTNVVTLTQTNAAGEQLTKSVTIQGSAFTYSFSEGATGPFFDLDIVLFNPGSATANLDVKFLTPTGPLGPKPYVLQPRSRLRLPVESLSGEFPALANGAVSTVVTSTNARPLAAERTLFWDASRYGGHGGTAVSEPSTGWYFAEGSQGLFDTFILLANDNAAPANVTVTFLRESGFPLDQQYTVAPGTRFNVWTAGIPALQNTSFGFTVTSDLPITVERAMYYSGSSPRLFEAGHESAGVTRAAREWFFAEGATGPYLDTYILVINPSLLTVPVTFTYRTDAGLVITKTHTVGPAGRLTVNVELADTQLANTAVSTTVSAPTPVVAERAMYWPGGVATWFEAHNSFGLTATGEAWAVADCRDGGAEDFETYVLLVNPEDVEARVLATFARAGLASPVQKVIVVPPNSRLNVTLASHAPEVLVPGSVTEFSATFETVNLTRIAVERATYWNSGGVEWAGGSNVTATRLR